MPKRILSGVQSSGKLHLGNYFGAIQQHIALQDQGEAFYFIADYHALTSLKDAEAKEAFEDDGWNRYRIVVQGNRYRSWVNGVATSDFTDDMDQQGFIGLQVHGIGRDEGPYQVRWRNIRIKELN